MQIKTTMRYHATLLFYFFLTENCLILPKCITLHLEQFFFQMAARYLKCFSFFFPVLFTYFFTLQYCSGFAMYGHELAMGVHVFPILNPRLTSRPIPSLWVIPVLQPRAPCLMHQTWTGDLFHI